MIKTLRLFIFLALTGLGHGAIAQCNELFFSEYIEGSSNNKALEIYNPTATSINLGDYALHRFANGGTTAAVFDMGGNIAANSVYVMAHPSANATILNNADTTSNLVINFNGNDAVALINTATGDTADVFGRIGEDPGASWPVGTGTSANYTLVRMSSVQMGTTNWSIAANQYDNFPMDSFNFLGTHTMTPCGSTVNVAVDFDTSINYVQEYAGTFNISLNYSMPSTSTDSIHITFSGAATLGTDYNVSLPSAGGSSFWLVTPSGSTDADFDINVVDDMLFEPNELIIMVMDTVHGSSAPGVANVFNLTILDNDAPFPYYTISQVRGTDANGTADSIGADVKLSGVVHGYNLRPNGHEFTIMDGTGGIMVFSDSSNFGYFPDETDSVLVTGTIRQHRGMLVIEPANVQLISTNGQLQTPTVVTQLNESTESELIKIMNVELVDTADWTTNKTPEAIIVNITDGTNTYVMYVDNNTTLYTEPVPEDVFHLTGIGGQISDTLNGNFLDGYVIVPRYKEDVEQAVIANAPIVLWDFDDDDSIADVGITANASKIMGRESTYSGTIAYNAGASGSAMNSSGWDAGTGVKHYIFEVNTQGYDNLTLSSKHRSSNTGPADFKAQYRIGTAGTWADIPGATVNPQNNWNAEINEVAIPSAASDQSSVFIRFVMTSDNSVNGGTVATAGTSRIDDVMVSGAVITSIRKELTDINLSVYPNPSTGVFNIETSSTVTGNITFIATDLTGRTVKTNTVSATANMHSIDLSNQPKGIYLLQVITDEGRTVKRLIVE